MGPNRKWNVDFDTRNSHGSMPIGSAEDAGRALALNSKSDDSTQTELKHKLAWGLALKPASSLPMNMFMMWMMGSGVSMWTMMMLIMMCMNPINAMAGMKKAFDSISKTESFWSQMGVYILMNLAGIGLAAYKCSMMGLIPSTQADWLEFLHQAEPAEYSTGGMA